MVIDIRRARSERNAAKFYGYPYFNFYLEENFYAHLFEEESVCVIGLAEAVDTP